MYLFCFLNCIYQYYFFDTVNKIYQVFFSFPLDIFCFAGLHFAICLSRVSGSMWALNEVTYILSTWSPSHSQAMSLCGIKPLNCEFEQILHICLYSVGLSSAAFLPVRLLFPWVNINGTFFFLSIMQLFLFLIWTVELNDIPQLKARIE